MKKLFGIIILLLLASPAWAAVYYVATTGDSPAGNDSNAGTIGAPWATFSKAMTVLAAGDTLFLKDGTYYQSLNVTVSGSLANPITIKAANDGQVIIDGQNAAIAIAITNRSYITIEGINAQNSSTNVIKIDGGAHHIQVKRCLFKNSTQARVLIYNGAHDNLIEDSILTGTGGRINIYNANYNTIRRNYIDNRAGNQDYAIVMYGGSYNIIENNIIIGDGSSSSNYAGITSFCHEYNDTPYDASHNKIYGNVIYNLRGWSFSATSYIHLQTDNDYKNNVGIATTYGLQNQGGANFTNNTIILNNSAAQGFSVSRFNYGSPDGDFTIATTSKQNAIIAPSIAGATGLYKQSNQYVGTWAHSYERQYNFTTEYSGTSAGTGDEDIGSNPYSSAYSTYGKGAYLMIPSALQGQGEGGTDIGAEVLYRYVNGTITGDALWPWPMESRICAETGYSVTYETGYTGCTSGGGIWQTLAGIYVSDTTAPTVPTNLQATATSATQISLTWTASTDAVGVVGYKLYRDTVLISSGITATSYNDAGLTASTLYTYTVSAYDAAGNVSDQSTSASDTTDPGSPPADTEAPSIPTNLAGTPISNSQINLTWTASTDNVAVTGYRLYRGGSQIADIASTSYNNVGLVANTLYSYTILAYDAAGNASSQSSAVEVTTLNVDTTPPSVPASVVATTVDSTHIGVTWATSTGTPAGYNVYRCTGVDCTPSVHLYLGVTGTSYANSSLTPETQYCYAVSSYDAANNESSLSTKSCDTTDAAPGGATNYNVVFGSSTTMTSCTDFSSANAQAVGDYQTWKLMWDFTSLYVCIASTDTTITATCNRDGSCWADDSIEIWLSPTHNVTGSLVGSDIHLVISANNNKQDSSGALGNTKDIPLYSKVTTGSGFIIWAKIPIALIGAIPRAGDVWGILMGENNGNTQGVTQKSWPAGVPVYAVPSAWNTLTFGVPNIGFTRLGE